MTILLILRTLFTVIRGVFFRGFEFSNLFLYCLYLFIHTFIYFGEEKDEDVEMLY